MSSPEQIPRTAPVLPTPPLLRPSGPWPGWVSSIWSSWVLLTTYNLATGEPLHGIPGILLFPACGGLAAVSWLKYRAENGPSSPAGGAGRSGLSRQSGAGRGRGSSAPSEVDPMKERIKAGLAALDLLDRVPPEAPEQLAEYGRLLLEKNQVMNLTAITDPDQVVKLHYAGLCRPALLCRLLRKSGLSTWAPVRASPAWCSRSWSPRWTWSCWRNLNKRLDWLAEVADTLGLSGLQTLHARAEEQALRPGWRDGFDIVTSRAVASLELLSELCLPYVKVGGQFLAMKAVDCEEELSRAAAGIARLGACCAPPMTMPSPAPTWSTGWSGWTRPLPPPRDTPEDGQKYRKLLCVNITPVILVYFLTITALCTNHS